MEDYRLEQTGQEVQDILNGAAMDANLQAEVERATDAEGTLQENIDAEEQARQDADGLLQQGIDDEAQRAKDAEEANAGEIDGIKALIPSTATSDNKLADTNYVNSSIQTATAEYRGDYNVVTDLHLAIDATHAQIETLLPTVIAEADKNDYCYVMIPTSAQTPTEIAKIERYKMTSEGWKFEYDVNNSTFTAEEWAAIKSGITSGLVGKLNALPTNADLLLLLAGKQDVLTFDSVPVPESNNPVKSGGVYSAIDDEKTARLNSDTAIHTELDGLQAKVPATASSDNKLVDQNQMNSSISTATATYRGDWNVVSDLHLAVDATRAQIAAMLPTVIATADNNDYCYVEIPTSADTPTQIERVERYKFNGTAWGYEYVLNNSGFTAAQWAAINSMITSGLVAKLSALPTNADLLAMFATKQDVLTFDPTPTENSTNPVTSGGVFAADKALSDAIEAILLLIPSAASSLNKLVDTSLMNSSISTATATFRGTYNLVSGLGLGIDATEGQIAAALLANISTADNNDYAFVQIPTSAETPAQIARTDRYKFNGTAWAFEYTLNTSGFTAAQWAAINSTITSALVAKLNALPTAAELQEALGVLTSGITAINQKIPSTASQSNKLVDNSSMESYIAQVINILDASFNVTSTDGHITLHITQVDGKITAVQVQSTDIASAADLALKASQADLTALASRVSTAEGNITSLTGRMGTAETNIANLQQLYNNLQQSKPVPVTALPGTGQQQGVIYRLAGTTSYSDYMWNGSTWVLMATYNNAIDPRPKKASQNLVTSGGVFDNIGAFDVSELNATENPHTLAQYADLSAALAAIPSDYQKGGMSIKFVQTSDNKYVQYRLMSDTFSTIENDWQGVDDEPTVGSNNLVKSGGVADIVLNTCFLDNETIQIKNDESFSGYILKKSDGSEFTASYLSQYGITPYINIKEADLYIIGGVIQVANTNDYAYACFYDINKQFISSLVGSPDSEIENTTVEIPTNAVYVRFTMILANNVNIRLTNSRQKTFKNVEEKLSNFFEEELITVKGGESYYILDKSSGEPVYNQYSANERVTPYILIDADIIYIIQGVYQTPNHDYVAVCFYDENKIYTNYLILENGSVEDYELVPPTNAKYLRFTVSGDAVVFRRINNSDKSKVYSTDYYLKGNSHIAATNKPLGIITAGQSNADGRNAYSELPSGFVNPNSKVQYCKNNNGIFADLQVTDGGHGEDWGFDFITYDDLTNPSYGNQNEIYVIKHTVGGTPINKDNDGEPYGCWSADYETLPSNKALLLQFENRIRKSRELHGEDFEIKAFLWHQGEGDTGSLQTAEDYYKNLKNVIAYVRGVVGNPRLHMFCGNLSLLNTYTDYVNIVNDAYARIESEDYFFHVVDMSDAPLKDGLHFTPESSIYFGQKVYDLMVDFGIISGTKMNPVKPWV